MPRLSAATITIVSPSIGPPVGGMARRRYGRTWGEASRSLSLESRFDGAVVDSLRARGHDVSLVEAWSDLMGHAQLIRMDADGFTGASDPRADGAALGW